ncbi:DUF2971 domain-containing protein [Bradyrhizobium sp. CCGB12]|uniref:DUF2971 domain-containing protein n=1 Tax=Bradyrhizobium sp. CCGB12 TaxID=2949632 RepID=UPI0020B1D50F|nr:DUF2971 domain-containing protein [Bradyrhizobium sp. CCGB12]MCP3389983.1 DUF2971 domain-containing protein [Bradyrhizobium sp. CCGB12]
MQNASDGVKTSPISNYIWETQTPPSLLWHYTNADALLGIARNQVLWCTEYRYLNDRKEISAFAIHLIARIREELVAIFGRETSDSIAEFVTTLYNTWNIFICSFCLDADRNEHWYQYAGKAGYSLGFDTYQLKALADSQGFTLGPTLYGESTAINIATAVLKDNLHKLEAIERPITESNYNEVVSFLCRLTLGYAPFFKAESFEREREWRLVRATGIDGDNKMQFRSKLPFGLVGYLPFSLLAKKERQDQPNHNERNTLIPRLMIGPGNETTEFTRAAHAYRLLAQNGFDAEVGETSSSLRL